MTKPPASVSLWMPIFIKEHRAAASTLSHPEHSAFCYLQMLLWENDGAIADDDKLLARHLRLSVKQWKAMRSAVLDGLIVGDGTISHPSMQAEIEKAKANVEQRRRAGIASAAARKVAQDGSETATGVATSVERGGNDTPTNGQPRGGSGEGEGYLPRDTLVREAELSREGVAPFRVIGGAK